MQTLLINSASTAPVKFPVQANSQNTAILHRLKSGRLLTIAPDSPGGLLIVKRFYVDFAGPGAAVGGDLDRDCTAIYVIGVVRFLEPVEMRDRQEGIYTRMTYAERLAVILDVAVPIRRSSLITEQLSKWLPGNLALTIPPELVAGLVGVLPTTVKLAWQTHKEKSEDVPTLLVSCQKSRLAQAV